MFVVRREDQWVIVKRCDEGSNGDLPLVIVPTLMLEAGIWTCPHLWAISCVSLTFLWASRTRTALWRESKSKPTVSSGHCQSNRPPINITQSFAHADDWVKIYFILSSHSIQSISYVGRLTRPMAYVPVPTAMTCSASFLNSIRVTAIFVPVRSTLQEEIKYSPAPGLR